MSNFRKQDSQTINSSTQRSDWRSYIPFFNSVDHTSEAEERSKKEEKKRKKEDEHQKKMEKWDKKIAGVKKDDEEKEKIHLEKLKLEKERHAKIEEERKIKEAVAQENHMATLEEQKLKNAILEAQAEEEHRLNMEKMEEERQEKMRFLEKEIEEGNHRREEHQKQFEIQRKQRAENSQAHLKDIELRSQKLHDQLRQMQEESEQSSLEWNANLQAELQRNEDAKVKEIESRKEEEEKQINIMKEINEEEERKAKELATSLTELKKAVTSQAREMIEQKAKLTIKPAEIESQDKIVVNDNKLQGTTDIIIPPSQGDLNIGVIGLPKTGRSTLIGALAGGLWPKQLSSRNPNKTCDGSNIYKLNYPNNGFVDGSVKGNEQIYKEFFEKSQLSNLSSLLITIDGNLREEDYLVITIAQKNNIPIAIIRTKLDGWLKTLPIDQTKAKYVEDDKQLILDSLGELQVSFPKEQIFNISSFAMIFKHTDGPDNEMIKCEQDEKSLMSFLNLKIAAPIQKDLKIFDVAVIGLKSAGKSTIIKSLQEYVLSNNFIFTERSYDIAMEFQNVIKELDQIDAKLFIIVVPNTIVEIDAKIIEYFIHSKKTFAVVLNKSDIMIQSLKKSGTFICKEDNIDQQHEAAKLEFSKLNLMDEQRKNIPMFVVSALLLMKLLDETHSTEEQDFIDFMGQSVGLLANPLTGIALQLGYNWLSSVSEEEQIPAEQIFLNTLSASGLSFDQLNAIMPNQQHYISRMQEMEGKIEAERALTRKYQESYNKMRRQYEKQQKKNEKMEAYLATAPSKLVRVNSEIKLSSQEAAKKNGVDNVNYVNYAFVGHTKNGKSSLINAIRGLNKNDEDAAGVDILECTQTIKYYTAPNGKMPNVRFYDVPGSGAMSHKAEKYYQEKALCGFDCLVILVQQTLAEEEIKYALAALEYNQKVVFVRSKCDIDFHLKDESGRTLRSIPSEKEIKDHIQELRRSFEKELEKHASQLSGIKCFFISAKSMRAIIRGEQSDMVFEEAEFLDYLYEQSKKARGIPII